jgi:hypothetical protein
MEAAAAHETVVATTITRPSIAITGASVPIAVAAAIAVHAAVSAISVAAIPGARADKDAAIEPRRSVVSVGRASIGIIAVVAISADGSRIAVTVSRVAVAISPIHRATDPNSNRDLSMGISRRGE